MDEIMERVIALTRMLLVGIHTVAFTTHKVECFAMVITALWCLEETAGLVTQRKLFVHLKANVKEVEIEIDDLLEG